MHSEDIELLFVYALSTFKFINDFWHQIFLAVRFGWMNYSLGSSHEMTYKYSVVKHDVKVIIIMIY